MYEQTTSNTAPLRVLEINSSGREQGSTSRMLVGEVIAALESRYGSVDVTRRDLAAGVPFVDADWITANFTLAEDRDEAQRDALAFSDRLIAELQDADAIVIGVPVYNFNIPAVLKAWIDMIARARVTFRYTDNGPKGLLEGKKAYIVVASGGVQVGSSYDFATPYLRHALAFVGITDIEFIGAEQLNSRSEESVDAARVRIADVIYTTDKRDAKVA
jgi:FMN-dependent NADH-azoreductase